MSGEGAEGSGAQARVTVEQEQEAGHAVGQREQGAVAGFVVVEGSASVACLIERVGEEQSLTESKGEAFSGNGVDGTGSIADEGDVSADDAAQAAGKGKAAALGSEGFGSAEKAAQAGEGVEDPGEARMWVAGRDSGQDRDADLGAAVLDRDGGDVGLTAGRPVDFNVGGRGDTGGEAEVVTEAEAADTRVRLVQTGPGAQARGGAVGADDPACADWLTIEGRKTIWVQYNGRVEGETDAEIGGTVAEHLVKRGAAEAEAGKGGEVGGSADVGVGERDAGEGEAIETGVMPSAARARRASGMSPSPHGLSMGGWRASARRMSAPRRRRAMAAASPAGPAPAMNTSQA